MNTGASQANTTLGGSADPGGGGTSVPGSRHSSSSFDLHETTSGLLLEIRAPLEPIAQPRHRHDMILQYKGTCSVCRGRRVAIGGKKCGKCKGLGIRIQKIPTKSLPTVKRNGKNAPHPVTAYRQELALVAEQVRKRWPDLFPICAPIDFWFQGVFPRPQTVSKRRSEEQPWVSRTGRYRRTSTPDYDNMAKPVSDAWEGRRYEVANVGQLFLGQLWRDDRYIWRAVQEKWVAGVGESPGIWARIRWNPAESEKTANVHSDDVWR